MQRTEGQEWRTRLEPGRRVQAGGAPWELEAGRALEATDSTWAREGLAGDRKQPASTLRLPTLAGKEERPAAGNEEEEMQQEKDLEIVVSWKQSGK